MDINIRKSSTFAAVILAAFLAMISVAAACVTFKGQMVVDGAASDTTVVGTGNSHGYCSTGRPTTAASGDANDPIKITVSKGTCGGTTHQLDAGTYEVKFNNRPSYTFDGTFWNMISSSGCFHPANTATSTTLSTSSNELVVDTNGNGVWNGSLASVIAPLPSVAGEAANLCIGDPQGPNNSATGGIPGMLAPYIVI